MRGLGNLTYQSFLFLSFFSAQYRVSALFLFCFYFIIDGLGKMDGCMHIFIIDSYRLVFVAVVVFFVFFSLWKQLVDGCQRLHAIIC